MIDCVEVADALGRVRVVVADCVLVAENVSDCVEVSVKDVVALSDGNVIVWVVDTVDVKDSVPVGNVADRDKVVLAEGSVSVAVVLDDVPVGRVTVLEMVSDRV